MDRFNRARSADSEIEEGLALIAAFPIETSRGLLDRPRLKDAIRSMRELTDGAFPATQRFEMLDADHSLCIETWPVKGSAHQLNRWTRLVLRDSIWLIESISEGFLED